MREWHCLRAMEEFYKDKLPLPIHQLKKILILKRNYFEVHGTDDLQIHGTAMGSPFATNFANIYMKDCKEHILTNVPITLHQSSGKDTSMISSWYGCLAHKPWKISDSTT